MKPPVRRLMPLNPLRAFEAVARNRSVTKAAEELFVTQSAVSRHIRSLEDRLGFPLFERTAQGLEFSHSSQAFASALTEAFNRIAQATDVLITTQAHSILTVRSYTTFLTRWLVPRLPDFQLRFPHIEVRLVAASGPVDFERDAADVGIRYGRGTWKGWSCDRLFNDELTPVCSPGYRDKIQHLSIREALTASTLLQHNLRHADWPQWQALAGCDGLQPKESLFFEDLGIIYECARAGLGLAMGQRAYVHDDLKLGRLVEAFPEHVLHRDMGYHLVCPTSRAAVPKIVHFREWMRTVAHAGNEPPALAGRTALEVEKTF